MLFDLFRTCGADCNELDGEGDTILHYCLKYCEDSQFIKRLVLYGSKINVQNWEGLCAFCLAYKEGKVELFIFFRRKLKLSGKQKCGLNCKHKKD